MKYKYKKVSMIMTPKYNSNIHTFPFFVFTKGRNAPIIIAIIAAAPPANAICL